VYFYFCNGVLSSFVQKKKKKEIRVSYDPFHPKSVKYELEFVTCSGTLSVDNSLCYKSFQVC
jgi:hypothetical protein